MPTSRSASILLAPRRRRLVVARPGRDPLASLGPRSVRRAALLDVPEGCEVLVVDRGVVLTSRGPGRHRLDPDDDLALADVLDPGRRRLRLPEVLVVDTGPLGPWAFHGPVPYAAALPTRRPDHRDAPGEGRGPHVHGHVVARVADPRTLVTGLARQVDLRRASALAHWLGRQVLAALATAPGGPDGTHDPSADTDLRAAVADRLHPVGLALVDLGPLEVVAAGPVRSERYRCAERAARLRPTPGPTSDALAAPVVPGADVPLRWRRPAPLGATGA